MSSLACQLDDSLLEHEDTPTCLDVDVLSLMVLLFSRTSPSEKCRHVVYEPSEVDEVSF